MAVEWQVSQSASGSVITQAQNGGVATVNVTAVTYAVTFQPVDPDTLSGAEQLLAALPLEAIPDLAPLPYGSHMLLKANPFFVGRQDLLPEVAATFKSQPSRTVVLTGIGGVGKSQLAVEFVHRYGQYFAGGTGGLELRPGFDTLPPADQLRLVLAAWSNPLPRLLVFDNCEDPSLLGRWRPPQQSGCRILVTSRRGQWAQGLGVREVELDALSPKESVHLLGKYRPDLAPNDADLKGIAKELGYLPLTLHLAGSYLESYRDYRLGQPAVYLAELRRPELLQHPSLTGETGEEAQGFNPTGHEQNVAKTFALSYERLDARQPTDAGALALLRRAASFALGEPIRREVLLATLQVGDGAHKRVSVNALERLIALGLLETEAAGAVLLHRLLGMFVRKVARDGAAQAAAEQVLPRIPSSYAP
jgi:hypothetical protein